MVNGVLKASKYAVHASLMCALLVALGVMAQSSKTDGEKKKELIPLPPQLKGFFKDDCFEKF